MNFKVKMNNIGKLKEADISVRPLTILAGPNNTGKSFFSKALYSVFSAMNSNPISAYIKDHLHPLREGIDFIQERLYDRLSYIGGYIEDSNENVEQEKNELSELRKLRKKIKTIQLESVSPLSYSESGQVIGGDHQKIREDLNKIIKQYKNLLEDENLKKKKTGSQILDDEEHQILDDKGWERVRLYLADLEKRESSDKDLKSEELTAIGFSKILEDNLTGNFQIPHLRKLTGDSTKPGSINVESHKNSTDSNIPDMCKVSIEDNKISSKLSLKGLSELQNSGILYIESPFYWKLRNALKRSSRFSSLLRSGRKSLLVPKYFNDLELMLIDELSGDMAFPDIFQKLEKIINGKIVMDESGTLQFKELKGKAHSLPMTATGVVQLGLLAFLIEKKVLDKGTVLFIDEPETNLHPAWQVEMMEVLFQLVKAGAYVVTATHSADMLKWLEVHLKDHPKDSHLIALNQMKINTDGTASIIDSDEDIKIKIRSVKENLTEPFLKLFLDGQKSE